MDINPFAIGIIVFVALFLWRFIFYLSTTTSTNAVTDEHMLQALKERFPGSWQKPWNQFLEARQRQGLIGSIKYRIKQYKLKNKV